MSAADGTNNVGHGHVYKRPDGNKARCGGPALCMDCRDDWDRQAQSRDAELTRLREVEKLSQAVVTLAFSNNHLDQEAQMWNALHALRAALEPK